MRYIIVYNLKIMAVCNITFSKLQLSTLCDNDK